MIRAFLTLTIAVVFNCIFSLNSHASIEPGWQAGLASVDMLTNTYEISSGPAGATTDGTTQTSNETEATPEIRALAEALQHDPKRIYEYVRNNIAYVPTYGIVNGASGCLLAGRGNDWDQSALLASLLRVSGYTTRFSYRRLVYYKSDLDDWIGTESNACTSVILNGGNPSGGINVPGYEDSYTLIRVWVEASIGGTWYAFDPAFKKHTVEPGIVLSTAMGYSQSSFLNGATTGATVTDDYAEDINATQISSALTSYASDLSHYVATNHPNADIAEIIGGMRIIPDSLTTYQTDIPFKWGTSGGETNWDSIPAGYHIRFRVQHNGIDETFYGYEIAGKTLALDYDVSNGNRPRLYVDGSLVATGNTTTQGQTYSATISVDHPSPSPNNSGTFGDQSRSFNFVSGSRYLVAHDAESSSARVVERHSRALGQYLAAGISHSDIRVWGAAMDVNMSSALTQWHLGCELISQLGGVRGFSQHFFGVLGATADGYYVDLPGYIIAGAARDGSTTAFDPWFKCFAAFSSALEHAMLEQAQGADKPAASTVKLLQISNANSARTYLANSSNWSSIQSSLQNYSSGRLSEIQSGVNAGYSYLLPRNAQIGLVDWNGIGYIMFSSSSIGMFIAGDYSGGYGGVEGALYGAVAPMNYVANAQITLPDYSVSQTLVSDPVNIHTGAFVLDKLDLSLGSTGVRGLHLARNYSSRLAYRDSVLGRGWTHSYDIRAEQLSEPFPEIGARQLRDVAPLVAQIHATLDLLSGTPEVEEWTTAIVASKWGADQIIQKATIAKLGTRSMEFIELPDGSYSAPPGVTAELIKTNGTYRIEERFGKTYQFNSNGRASTISDADGNTLTFSYNTQTNLQSVTDSEARSLTFTYSGDKLSQVSDGTGRTLSFGYSGDDLTSVTDPDGNQWTYQYDTQHQLISATDPLSQATVSNIYNDVGQVVTQYNGHAEQWAFHCGGSVSAEIDPLGNRTTHYFDDTGRNLGTEDALGNRTYNIYDAHGQVVTNIDANGNATILSYDADHNLTNRVDALGNEWAYEYDSEHRLVAEADPLGNMVRYEYDSEHHLTSISNVLGETTTTYTSDGLPHVVTDANGNQSTYTYDSYSNPEKIARTDGGTVTNTWNARGELTVARDALGNESTYTYNKRGLLISMTDADGNVVSNVYNAAGLKTQSIDQRGNATTYTYTPTYEVSTIDYPDDGSVSNTYDAANRLVAITDGEGNTTTISRDAAGRRTALTDDLGHTVSYALDANGNRLAVTNPIGHVVYSSLDALNRVTNTWDQIGSQLRSAVSEFDIAGRQSALVNALDQRTQFARDALGRITTVTRPDQATEHNAYDALGNLLSYTNAKGVAIVRTTYDGMSRPLAQTNALGNGRSWTYDAAGNQLTRTDANGDTTDYTFDELNRVESVEYPDASDVSFTYDEAGNLSSAANDDATLTFGYDEMHRVSAVTQSVLSVSSVVTYTHDKNGNRTGVTLPGSKSVTYTYDDANRLTGLSSTLFGSSFSFTYNDANELTGIAYPNGVTATYTRDDGGRVTGIAYADGGTTLASRTYEYNALGQITKRNITVGFEATPPDTHQHFRHNAADQLTHLSRMDNYENPERWRDVGPGYHPAGTVSNITVRYNGMNLGGSFSWDYEGRLTGYSGEHQTNLWYTAPPIPSSLGFKYDALGGRVTRTGITGGEKIHVLDHAAGLKNVLVQRASNGTIERYYVYAPGFGLVAHVEADGTARYYHGDHLGSTIALTDANGDVTDQFDYTPYGELMGRTGSTDTPYTFVGRHGVYWDGAALYHMKARYYRADLARFISVDPLGIAGGVNLYAYANGDPVRFLDALGFCGSTAESGVSFDIVQMFSPTSAALSRTTPLTGSTAGDLDLAMQQNSIRGIAAAGGTAAVVTPQVLGTAVAVTPAVSSATVGLAQNVSTSIGTAGAAVAEAGRRLATWQPFNGLVHTTSLQGNHANPLPSITTPSISTVQFGSMVQQAQPVADVLTGMYYPPSLPVNGAEATGMIVGGLLNQ